MKKEELFESIGDVDDALLARCGSAGTARKKNVVWLRFGAAAACLCLVLLGTFTLRGRQAGMPGVIDRAPDSAAGSIYAAPENGAVLLFTEVNEAIRENQDKKFFLGIDFFKNGKPLDPSSDAVRAELERLKSLGFQVGYAVSWTYQGENEKLDVPYTAGYFTADQLARFPADEGYGYAFHFVTNGDGTPVSAEQGITEAIQTQQAASK